jgi:hypothetical protein
VIEVFPYPSWIVYTGEDKCLHSIPLCGVLVDDTPSVNNVGGEEKLPWCFTKNMNKWCPQRHTYSSLTPIKYTPPTTCNVSRCIDNVKLSPNLYSKCPPNTISVYTSYHPYIPEHIHPDVFLIIFHPNPHYTPKQLVEKTLSLNTETTIIPSIYIKNTPPSQIIEIIDLITTKLDSPIGLTTHKNNVDVGSGVTIRTLALTTTPLILDNNIVKELGLQHNIVLGVDRVPEDVKRILKIDV